MPFRILLLLLLVNFSAFAFSQSTPTQIRGPKSSDNAFTQQQFGPLTASDTLWRIAEQVKPNDSVTTYQVMYALFVKNPGAFNDANFNHLRPGAILILPDLREIRSVDAEQARRKADLDDQAWAERTRREAEARARAREQVAKPNLVQQQTLTELNALKDNYQSSMQLIEGIARENEQLRSSLGRVQQELEGLKNQLAEDSELQQQLNQLLQQQQQILAEQEARRQAEEAARLAASENPLTQLLSNPLSWVLAAITPALLALFGVMVWIRKRGQKTEQVVAAATKEPVAPVGYQSPVPPLDTSQDFDDSLFTLDDSLLDDAFETSTTGKAGAAAKNLVDDDLPDFSDDILLDDFDNTDPLKSELLDAPQDESLDFSLDDAQTTTSSANDLVLPDHDELSFDADNILSDTDLASLLDVEDEAEEVIELADPEQTETVSLMPQPGAEVENASLNSQDDIDNLLEEIELDWPTDETIPTDDIAAASDKRSELTWLTDTEAATDNLETDWAQELQESTATDTKFDSSELEAFAEQLAAEGAFPEQDDEVLITEDEALLQDELDDILVQAAEQTRAAEEAAAALDAEAALDSQTDAGEELPSVAEAPAEQLMDDSVSNEISTAKLADIEPVLPDADEITEAMAELDFSELNEAEASVNLDLAVADDSSVVRPTEATLAVENPSQMLEDYPELDLSDFDPENEQQLEVLSRQLENLTTEPDAKWDGSDESVELTPEDFNLSDLEDSQFDDLLDELAQTEAAVAVDDAESAADVELAVTESRSDALVSDGVKGVSDADFVEIDNLLSALEQGDNDDSRFEQLNVDVGLDEFADIIGEHTKMDVDQEDNGFAAKLDLVRAYIEMDEPESANLLIEEILTSDAPAHVKDEVRSLRPE
jgi:pilus assembly protein FimV